MWCWSALGGWHWLTMAAVWLLVVGGTIWAATRLTPTSSRPPRTPDQILDERFARGEVSPTEYRQLRDELERWSAPRSDLRG
jgi:putative membrane protein